MTLALLALVTLVSIAAKSLMHINELDLITVKVDIYIWDSYSGSPENTIYNQEVIKLNKNLFVEKDVGSDCLIQAEGQSKVVVSVQSDLEKMKLVQKLFTEAACFKGWSAEITKIPLVSLKRCKVEVVTEKKLQPVCNDCRW